MALSVTVLSGFLGSGKTSLLKHILQNRAGLRCAVIVNEITDENIDSYAMGGTALLRGEEKMVEMANGCICCTLRKDLLVQLRELAADAKYDCVVIESSGISEPMHVAETFMTDLNDGQGPLEKVARLDTCVTVVDASEVRGYLQGRIQRAVTTQQKEGSYSAAEVDADGNTRNIAQLLVEQLEFANVIVLNKTDRIDRRSVAEIVELIRVVNPTAKILPTVHSVVPRLSDILITGAFTAEFAASIKGWMQEDPEQHNPETLEYGVSSVMFREQQRPFHPGRLHAWISEYWGLSEMPPDDHQSEASSDDSSSDTDEGSGGSTTATTGTPTEEYIRRRTDRYGGDLFRVKGFVWVGNPSRLGYYVCVSAAGSTLSFLPGGGWGTFPARSGSGTTSVSPHQRLAIVGQYINKERILADLNALLLTPAEEAELKRAMVGTADADIPPADIFDDPFEPFGQEGDEHHE